MHPIVKEMWNRNLNLVKWSKLNGFNPRYARRVIHGKAGVWGVGTAEKIKQALRDQGYMK